MTLFQIHTSSTVRVILLSGILLLYIPGKVCSTPSDSTVQEYLSRAKEHFFAERYSIALRLFNMVLDKDPENVEAYSFSGDILLKLGDAKKAEKRFRIASELSSEPSREYFRLGQALYIQKRGTDALESFRKSLSYDPQLHINRFYIGLVYLRLIGDTQATIDHWVAFRKLLPDDPQGPEIDRAIEILRGGNFLPEEMLDPELTGLRSGSQGGCYPMVPCQQSGGQQSGGQQSGGQQSGGQQSGGQQSGGQQSGGQQSGGQQSGGQQSGGQQSGGQQSGGQQSGGQQSGGQQSGGQQSGGQQSGGLVIPDLPGVKPDYKKGDPEQEKQRSKPESIIQIDDL